MNFNQGALLRDCIRSVKAYSADIPLEWIVVDNSNAEDITPFLSEFDDILLIRNTTNVGFAAANNQALERATGVYSLLLNNDTLFLENTLDHLIRFEQDAGRRVILGCKLLNSDGSHQHSVVDFLSVTNQIGEYFGLSHVFPESKRFNKFHLSHTSADIITPVDVIKGAFMFAKTADLKSIGGMDESFFFYNEEDDLCQRFKQSGGEVWYVPTTRIVHLGGATTTTMKWFSIHHQHRSKLIYIQKHFSGAERLFLMTIHLIAYAVRVPIYLLIGVFTLRESWISKAVFYGRCLFSIPTYRKIA